MRKLVHCLFYEQMRAAGCIDRAFFMSPMSDNVPPLRTQEIEKSAPSAAYSPLYQQIKALLLQGLDRGEWKPGEAIPSELELAARFQVSQGTVRKAIDELAADNLLIRRQGKGTFVATHHEARVRFRFLRLAPDDGKPVASQSRILDVRRMKAPTDVAVLLDLRTSDMVVNLRRVLSFDQVPTIYDDIWLPGSVFKGLTLEAVEQNKGPMYAWFESKFGVSMVRADEKIGAISATEEAAAVLQVAAGSPLLHVERVSYTYGDRPMELRRGLYLTERFHYRNTLS